MSENRRDDEKKVNKVSKKGKNKFGGNRSSKIKPMIVTILSALFIGSMLGFVMIKMFTNIDLNSKSEPVQVNASLNEDTNTENNDNKERDLITSKIDEIDAFVLQVGVFTEIENAKEWQGKFDESGYKALIWEKEDQYFLLAGIADTKDKAVALATEIKGLGFDVFVKEWQTDKLEKEFTIEEDKWVQSYVKTWKEALESISKQSMFLTENWSNLTEDVPENSDQIIKFIDVIKKQPIQEFEEIDEQHKQNVLLELWYHYSEAFN